ncbi:2-5A-dependent ribonuclease-like [Dendronephthya gigantea]|uniref:2-5A-dependent ribonuclease-like n=1 Tax=Dendronephthya gigantea TaxID=151771 RepID=UPI00106A4F83|nr:2-5A-dependent ribonuclease-like [Dendronephthya gigantea]XP_028395446.1 2-5A-dependent ribonuclease-like [Dendronephthya gigantea]
MDKKQEASGSTSVCEYGSKHLRDDEIASQSPMQSSSLAIVKFLVKYCGADLSCKDESGKTVLHHAVHVGETEIVKYFVEQCGADVNAKDKNERTVLNYAVTEGLLEMVKYLVEHGADVNGMDINPWTVLHDAVKNGTPEIVKYLVEHGTNVNDKGAYGWTVLHHAVTKGTLEIVKYLVEHGADVNGKDKIGRTALKYAVTEGLLEMVKYLVEQGADVNGKGLDGRTMLHYAVNKGSLEMVKYLVEHGADVNGKNKYGWTVLHDAITKGRLIIVKYLVEKGADVNSKNTHGWTVLHVAVRLNILQIVKYLVEKGADVTLHTHTLGIDILKMAVVKNSVALVNLVLEKNIAVWRAGTFLVEGRQMSLLEWSIHHGHDEITTILKSSVNHREKIQMLKTMNCNQLKETEAPMQAFVAKNQFKIGAGGFSCVYVGLMKDGSEVAVKRILVQNEDETVENEKEIMSLIETNSPFIVKYRHFHRDDTFMYLIVDLCEETLRKLVQASSIEHVQEHGPRMIREILSGLEFLHGKGILHRDLKPSNVLVDIEGRMKLADFGISRVLNEDETTVETFAKGTRGWMPPEVIEAIKRNEKGRFKRKSDVHVAGMIAFYVLTKGEHPFGSELDRMKNISENNPVNLEKLGDHEARRFVSWLINHKIDDRPRAHEVLRDSLLSKPQGTQRAIKQPTTTFVLDYESFLA